MLIRLIREIVAWWRERHRQAYIPVPDVRSMKEEEIERELRIIKGLDELDKAQREQKKRQKVLDAEAR